jgi:cyanophycinase
LTSILRNSFHDILLDKYHNEEFIYAGTSAERLHSNTMIYQGSSSEALLKGEVKNFKWFRLIDGVIITHFVQRGRIGIFQAVG